MGDGGQLSECPRERRRRTLGRRAIRGHLAHPTAWERFDHRRPIVESANYGLNRRFGDRLHCHGLRRQRKEVAFRILTYNASMVQRNHLRNGVDPFHGRES